MSQIALVGHSGGASDRDLSNLLSIARHGDYENANTVLYPSRRFAFNKPKRDQLVGQLRVLHTTIFAFSESLG